MQSVFVGMGSCGIAAGAREVFDAVERWLASHELDVNVRPTGCYGMCYREVLIGLPVSGGGQVLHGNVSPEGVDGLLAAHFDGASGSEESPPLDEAGFLADQTRLALARCGRLDPESLDAYLKLDGFAGLRKALTELTPEQVIDRLTRSGLRGRGGAGFPTGRKWAFARAASGDAKVVICNADEGDPGAFMDRNLIEGDPFCVLEGMAIAGYAIGATRGIVYVRAEYPLAVERLELARDAATAAGMLGPRMLGSAVDFHVEIRRGAGAFVCGEETAMIASLEGGRGTPRRRPPYPVERGLEGQPTCINNVETLATVPWVLQHGADGLRRFGTTGSAGTKVFSLAGDLARTGLAEVPMGTTVRDLVVRIAGGSGTDLPLKAVQLGGPSGGCLPVELFETPIDYESLASTGTIMGSGGVIGLDSSRCMVDIARYFLAFTQRESCGKCTFCRIGTKRMLEILDRLCEGEGQPGDLDRLDVLAKQVAANSLCGLGKSAPTPVLTTLRYFRSEYEAHAREQRCPAGRCRKLIRFGIDPWRCDGCTLCRDQCPAGSITLREDAIGLEIDPGVCARCGGCKAVCPFGAIDITAATQ